MSSKRHTKTVQQLAQDANRAGLAYSNAVAAMEQALVKYRVAHNAYLAAQQADEQAERARSAANDHAEGIRAYYERHRLAGTNSGD